ncbi:MAG: hypothetical protein LBR34_08195 [Prevotella sp.]|jgi:hypothetical protein|nr:hypothetical protein [Prevotella sp.]
MKHIDNIINKIAANKETHFWLFFAVLLVLSLIMTLSYKLYPSFDFYFHYRRLNALMEALLNGSFPIYIDYAAADGYGYATKWFYPDLVLVPFAITGILTNAVFAFQYMWFIMTVLCGTFMYIAVKRIYKSTYTAAIASILFTFCTYRLLDMYNRSAVGEALSFTFVPLIFWGLYEIIKGDHRKWYILAIGYSLMIFTHVLSSFLMFITLLIIVGVYYKSFINEPKRLYGLLFAGISTLIITAYFLYPMLEQMLSNSFYYQTVVKAHPDDHKQKLNWIIWGLFSGIVHPKQIFIPATGVLLTWAVSLRLFVKGNKSPLLKSVDVGVIIGFIYIFLASWLIPWRVFPFNKLLFIQLPWRLYEFVSYFFAIAGGYYLTCILHSKRRLLAGAAMVILGTIFVLSSSGKDYQFENSGRDVNEIPTRETNNFHLYGMEYIPSKVPSIDYIAERGWDVTTKYGSGYNNFEHGLGQYTSLFLRLSSDKKYEVLEFPLFYYKGYAATMEYEDIEKNRRSIRMDIPVKESEHGLVEITVPNMTGSPFEPEYVEVYYAGTTIQKVSPFISIFGVLALTAYIIVYKRKKRSV